MKYNLYIDGLRGIAIIFVLLVHANVPLCDGGFIGVDIFFVISGFLITSLLLAEHKNSGVVSLKNFYIRRILRLFPALFFLLFCYALASSFSVNPYRHFREIFTVVFYFSNWVQAFRIFNIVEIGHLWSLSVEEQFYFVWPTVLCSLFRLKSGMNVAISAALLGFCLSVATRVALVGEGADTFRVYFGTDTRLDNILLGVLAALLVQKYGAPSHIWLKWGPVLGWPVIGIFLVTGFTFPLSSMYTFGLTTVGVASLCILLTAAYGPSTNISNVILGNKFLVWTGKLSYSLYLWHFLVMEPINKKIAMSSELKPIVGILISYIVASISYYVIEKHFLIVKDALFMRKKKAAINAPATPSCEGAIS